MSSKRFESALELGRPTVLRVTNTLPRVGECQWDAIWPVSCACGGRNVRLLDYLGGMDRCDPFFLVECSDCRARWEPLALSGSPEEDGPKDDWDSDLEEPVVCGSCRKPGIWQLEIVFRYAEDLQDQAEDDFPEFFEEGLANQWESLELRAKCMCGHEAVVLYYDRS